MYQIDPGDTGTEKVGNSAFHSLLDKRRITKKLFTEQAKEFSAFIPSDPSTTMKAKHCIIKLKSTEVSCKNIHSLATNKYRSRYRH